MKLLFPLSEELHAALCLSEGETIRYAVPYDIDLGKEEWCRDGYIVVTDQRLVVAQGSVIQYETLLRECTKIKCLPEIGCGLLAVTKDGMESVICRFSMKHLNRVSFVIKGADLIREGKTEKKVESIEREKTCLRCGHPLQGARECPKCSGKGSMFLRFWDICKNYKGRLLVISLLMLASSAFNLLIPEIQKQFIDNTLVGANGSVSDIVWFVLIMLALSVLFIASFVLRNWQCVSLGSQISMDLREKMYRKLQILSLAFIQDRTPGALMNRIVQDTTRIRSFMEEAFGQMLSVMVTMVCAAVFMFSINVKLTLLSLVFIPVAFSLSVAWRKNIHTRYHMQWMKGDKVNSALQDVISGMRVVKSYGKEKPEADKFFRLTSEFSEVQKRNEVFWAAFFPLLTFVMGLGIYFVTYFGGVHVLADEMTVGELTQFIAYAGILYGPLNWMTHLPRMIMQMFTSLERIGDILDEEPLIKDKPKAQDVEFRGNIEFKHVSFGYKSYLPVLEDISFQTNKGEMIGFVGESGAGKSTIINLIMRLYDADDGEILVDGKNISDIRLESFHAQIGVVLQETFLFSGTILNNIRFARPDATYEQVIRAAKMANAHDFISKTPDGYDTWVGERGYTLSGGERQRISIARAILNDPKLLILDEATSSLDTESEYLIQKALSRLTAGRTTFAIAHRLSTLKDADRLIVIDGHRIAEMGTHNELMEKKGIYYGLVTAQLEMSSLKSDGDETLCG